MKIETFKIKGMHCASCASIIEKTLGKVEGVESIKVNSGTEKARIFFDSSKTNPEILSKHIEPLGYSLMTDVDHSSMTASEMGMSEDEHKEHLGINQSKKEKLLEIKSMRNKLISLVPIVIISIFVMSWDIFAQFSMVSEMSFFWSEFFHHLLPILATYTLFVVGQPYLFGLYRFFRYGKANMDTLIGLGTLVAFIYSFVISAFEESLSSFINVNQSYYDVVIVVITFITLGKYLEAQSKLKTKAAFILYFYTTAQNCSECEKQGLALSALRDKYPELRVYSFDFSTDLSAVKSMLQIYKIQDTKLPALVIDDNVLTGFHGIDELEARIKESFKLQEIKPKGVVD